MSFAHVYSDSQGAAMRNRTHNAWMVLWCALWLLAIGLSPERAFSAEKGKRLSEKRHTGTALRRCPKLPRRGDCCGEGDRLRAYSGKGKEVSRGWSNAGTD